MEGEDALPAAAEDDRGERSYVAVGAIAGEASGTYYKKKCKERGVGRLYKKNATKTSQAIT